MVKNQKNIDFGFFSGIEKINIFILKKTEACLRTMHVVATVNFLRAFWGHSLSSNSGVLGLAFALFNGFLRSGR